VSYQGLELFEKDGSIVLSIGPMFVAADGAAWDKITNVIARSGATKQSQVTRKYEIATTLTGSRNDRGSK